MVMTMPVGVKICSFKKKKQVRFISLLSFSVCVCVRAVSYTHLTLPTSVYV